MDSASRSPAGAERPLLGFLILACALSTFPPVTGDIYLPALPRLTTDLGATVAQGQLTLSGYFLGLGVGQLLHGPLADRVGRKPVMLIAAILYLAATAGCLVATSIGQLVALRFAQAMAACAGIVISSAMVRDRLSHQESAAALSMLLTARSLGPLLAPIAGGVLVTLAGWRGVFGALCVFGAVMLIAVIFAMPETRTEMVAQRARQESPVRAYAGVLRDRRILGYMLTGGLNYGCLFAWVAAAPFLLIEEYGVSELWFGWIFALMALCLTVSAQINRRVLRRRSSDTVMFGGTVLGLAGAVLLLTAVATGFGGLPGVLVPLAVVLCSIGFVSTNATAGALSVDPSRTGSVSAVVGTAQFGCGALAAWGTSQVSRDPAMGIAAVVALCAAGAILYPLYLWRRAAHGAG